MRETQALDRARSPAFLIPETHGPTILKRRAEGHIHAFSQEELEQKPAGLWDIVQNHFLRAASERATVSVMLMQK
jgi:hypothetical protein